MTNGSEWVVSEVGAGGDVEGVELGAVGGEAVYCLVRQLVTRGQVEGLNVAAVGGEAAEGGVAHILMDVNHKLQSKQQSCSLRTWQPLRLRLLRKPPHLLARFSTTVPSMSTWNSNKSTFCQFEPSRANTFQGLLTWCQYLIFIMGARVFCLTWADLQSDMMSR